MNNRKKQHAVSLHQLQNGDPGTTLASPSEIESLFRWYKPILDTLVPKSVPCVVAGGHAVKSLARYSSKFSLRSGVSHVSDMDLFFESQADRERVVDQIKFATDWRMRLVYATENSQCWKLNLKSEVKCDVDKFDIIKKFQNFESLISQFDLSCCCLGIYKPVKSKLQDYRLLYNQAFIDSVTNRSIEILNDPPTNKRRTAIRLIKYMKRGFQYVSLKTLYKASNLMTEWYNENVFNSSGEIDIDKESDVKVLVSPTGNYPHVISGKQQSQTNLTIDGLI